jgi:integrase/recombinase XerD
MRWRIAYLQSRPKLPYRELFLRVRAPHGPLERTAITDIFQHWARQSGLDIPFQGSHCVRHSYAVHLLRQGVSVKAIGDLLGHRTTESTDIYLRLAIEDLRSVALPVPQKTETGRSTQEASSVPQRPKRRCVAGHASSSVWRSFLAEDTRNYLQLKHALGRIYRNETRSLRFLDAFLAGQYPHAKDLTGEMFMQWCATLQDLSPTGRRNHMRVVRNLCLYRRRSRPGSFLPDPLEFPENNPPVAPRILSESEMACILETAGSLHHRSCPLRAETLRIAFLLLYATGIRRGELVRLTLGDIDARQQTLFIRETKFHKSRLIPLSESVASELEAYLRLRQKKGLPMDLTSSVAWHGYFSEGKGYGAERLFGIWATLCASLHIFTMQGKPPRLHDIRHSFAVNALLRWYRNGEDVQAKLPLLSTYLGHASVISTHHYLTSIEELRSEASKRFYQHCGSVITPNPSGDGGAL